MLHKCMKTEYCLFYRISNLVVTVSTAKTLSTRNNKGYKVDPLAVYHLKGGNNLDKD